MRPERVVIPGGFLIGDGEGLVGGFLVFATEWSESVAVGITSVPGGTTVLFSVVVN